MFLQANPMRLLETVRPSTDCKPIAVLHAFAFYLTCKLSAFYISQIRLNDSSYGNVRQNQNILPSYLFSLILNKNTCFEFENRDFQILIVIGNH